MRLLRDETPRKDRNGANLFQHLLPFSKKAMVKVRIFVSIFRTRSRLIPNTSIRPLLARVPCVLTGGHLISLTINRPIDVVIL